MRTAARPSRLKRATRSATVVPLCKPASRAAWINTPVRATASNAVARRTWSTRSLLLLAMRCKAARSARLRRRNGSRCGVGICFSSGQVSGKDSSSGHFRHDPLATTSLASARTEDLASCWLTLVVVGGVLSTFGLAATHSHQAAHSSHLLHTMLPTISRQLPPSRPGS